MSSKDGTGQGRASSRRTRARAQGNDALAEELTPPSEQHLLPSERCGAITQPGAKHPRCVASRGAGTDHPGYGNCVKHGGNTDAGVKSAMREMGANIRDEYKANYGRFGGDRNDPSISNLTPEQALIEEIRRTAAFVRFLEERIGHWNLSPVQAETLELWARSAASKRKDKTLTADVREFFEQLDSENPDSPSYLPALITQHERTGFTAFTDAREWLYLYREERGHLARTCKMAIDAGVAQRLVTIAEDQGRILASSIRAVLLALNLSPEQAELVPKVVPQVLRAVASNSPIPDISSLTGSRNELTA